ncbi:restriction endonuclease subunit S [Pseudobacteroides cellulosolvens]|uniref:Restriction modification system DNA specificity domain-containing protein n=1 Tax=Pseudobacteroides cellulosolvens ATCC 35603 = DSM 2933 TaxID=398512 RepID=A0A0L6JPJ6_9FIRM|nr:restriction endonuclease subunit S [Pseudobacteroides cellulosolvens]KNY27694.1 restriction modification system DNA specificity domain-containing protein [Pseudobacteroides cellulosolvens ATCC 35603 = DSM 2933]
MIELSFPTIKLGKYIKEIKTKVKNTDLNQKELTVYGVTNTEGITVTNNKASDDLGNYIVLGGNQFAYNPYRINIGSIGLSASDVFGVVSPAYVVFETTAEISSEFLFYYLKSTLGINLIKWYGDRGGVRSALRFADLKKLDFPDISLEQQLSILEKVKQIDDRLSELIENLSLKNISSLRQSILQQAIEGKLCPQDPNDEPASVLLKKIKDEKEKLLAEKKIKNQKGLPPIIEEEKPFELPQGWEWCILNDIVDNADSAMKRGPFGSALVKAFFVPKGEKTYKVYEQKNAIYDNSYIGDYYISEEKYNSLLGFKVAPGDLIISCSGVTLGRISKLADDCEPGIINQALLKLTLNKKCIIDDYFIKLFRSFWFQGKIFDKAKGSAIPNMVGMPELKKLLIPLPPLVEQQRIVEKVDKLMDLCDELEQEVSNAKKYASQLIEAVLQEAFSGKTETSKDSIIELVPSPQPAKEVLLAAARGNMGENTWKNLQKRALELASEEI